MNNLASQILTEQLQGAHGLLNMTLNGVTPEVASYAPTGMANSIADTYVHIIVSEDWLIHFLLQNKQPLFTSELKDKTGIESFALPADNAFPAWTKGAKINMEELKAYADKIFAISEAYVKNLTDENLQKEADLSAFGMGKSTVAFVISSIITSNLNLHTGEISAIKGVQGLKGYPM